MKRLMVAIASGSSAAVLFAATPVDRVLTIDLAEDTLLSALTDEVSCLQNNEATNVVLQGGKKLTLDVNLDQYAGGWDIKNGVANLTKGKNGFGVYGDGAPVVVSSSSGQICMNGNVEIDKPVHFAVSSESAETLSLARWSSNNVFKRKVTVAGAWKFSGGGSFTTAGGFEQPYHESGNYRIYNTGNGSSWIVENVPVQIDAWSSTYHTLELKVGGNRIRRYMPNYGSAISIQCDDAFAADCLPTVLVSGAYESRGGFSFQMNGHDVVLGDVDWGTSGRTNIQPGQGEPTLTQGGAADYTFKPASVNAAVRLEKRGAGKLTIGTTFDNVTRLTVTEGAVDFADGAALPSCMALTLNGGSVSIPAADTFSDSAVYAVADPEAKDVLAIADGVTCVGVGFSIGGVSQGGGVYGGAASTAEKKRDCFSATATGLLSVDSSVVVDVTLDATVNLSDAVSEEDYAKINNNDYTGIIKTGPGTLVLDKSLTFSGGWEIRGGTVNVSAQDGLGVYGDGAEVKITDGSAQLYVSSNTIDKPIHFAASQAEGLYMLNMRNTTTYFARKMTVDANLGICFGGSGSIYCDGGLEQKSGTITDAGQSGTWHIRNVPATINAVRLTYQPLYLDVAGNAIKTISFAVGGRLHVTCDDALSGCKATITGGSNSTGLELNGHNLVVGDLTASCPIKSSGGTGTLIIENETDSDFNATAGDATLSVNLVKRGAGKKTLASDFAVSSGALRVEGGSFDFGTHLTGWTNLTLAGGKVVLGGDGNIARAATVTVEDATAEGVIEISDGVTLTADKLYLGAEQRLATGYHGGAASSAPVPNRLACFDANATGLIFLYTPYEVTIDEDRTLTDGEKTLLVDNKVGKFVKKGAGRLTLDTSLEGYKGAWDIVSGEVYVSTTDHAFGDDLDLDEVAISMNYGAGARFTLANGAVNRRVVSTGTADGDDDSVRFIQCVASTKNTFRYQVKAKDRMSIVLQSNSDTKLTTEGPFVALSTVYVTAVHGTWDLVGPMTCNASVYLTFADINFRASQNDIAMLQAKNGTGITLYADDPFTPQTCITLCPNYMSSSATLNLNGYDTAVSRLILAASGECTVGVSTPANAPATLSFSVDKDSSMTLPVARSVVTGPISLVKRGEGRLQIDGEMPFKGKSFAIEGGTLAYGVDAPERWRLNELSVADGATVSIAAGKEIRAKVFAYAGRVQTAGIYGGAASPAPDENQLPCFDPEAGGTVCGGSFGMSLIVR